MHRRLPVTLAFMGWVCAGGLTRGAFIPGNIYATNTSYNAVFHYGAGGSHKGTTFLPSDPIFGLAHGLTFGPDGLLYFVKQNYPNSSTGEVLALDSALQVKRRYAFAAGMSAVAVGDIAFDARGHFYVGAVGRVLQFTIGAPDSATVVWEPASYVYGVDVLPTGNLLIGLEFGPHEFNPA